MLAFAGELGEKMNENELLEEMEKQKSEWDEINKVAKSQTNDGIPYLFLMYKSGMAIMELVLKYAKNKAIRGEWERHLVEKGVSGIIEVQPPIDCTDKEKNIKIISSLISEPKINIISGENLYEFLEKSEDFRYFMCYELTNIKYVKALLIKITTAQHMYILENEFPEVMRIELTSNVVGLIRLEQLMAHRSGTEQHRKELLRFTTAVMVSEIRLMLFQCQAAEEAAIAHQKSVLGIKSLMVNAIEAVEDALRNFGSSRQLCVMLKIKKFANALVDINAIEKTITEKAVKRLGTDECEDGAVQEQMLEEAIEGKLGTDIIQLIATIGKIDLGKVKKVFEHPGTKTRLLRLVGSRNRLEELDNKIGLAQKFADNAFKNDDSLWAHYSAIMLNDKIELQSHKIAADLAVFVRWLGTKFNDGKRQNALFGLIRDCIFDKIYDPIFDIDEADLNEVERFLREKLFIETKKMVENAEKDENSTESMNFQKWKEIFENKGKKGKKNGKELQEIMAWVGKLHRTEFSRLLRNGKLMAMKKVLYSNGTEKICEKLLNLFDSNSIEMIFEEFGLKNISEPENFEAEGDSIIGKIKAALMPLGMELEVYSQSVGNVEQLAEQNAIKSDQFLMDDGQQKKSGSEDEQMKKKKGEGEGGKGKGEGKREGGKGEKAEEEKKEKEKDGKEKGKKEEEKKEEEKGKGEGKREMGHGEKEEKDGKEKGKKEEEKKEEEKGKGEGKREGGEGEKAEEKKEKKEKEKKEEEEKGKKEEEKKEEEKGKGEGKREGGEGEKAEEEKEKKEKEKKEEEEKGKKEEEKKEEEEKGKGEGKRKMGYREKKEKEGKGKMEEEKKEEEEKGKGERKREMGHGEKKEKEGKGKMEEEKKEEEEKGKGEGNREKGKGENEEEVKEEKEEKMEKEKTEEEKEEKGKKGKEKKGKIEEKNKEKIEARKMEKRKTEKERKAEEEKRKKEEEKNKENMEQRKEKGNEGKAEKGKAREGREMPKSKSANCKREEAKCQKEEHSTEEAGQQKKRSSTENEYLPEKDGQIEWPMKKKDEQKGKKDEFDQIRENILKEFDNEQRNAYVHIKCPQKKIPIEKLREMDRETVKDSIAQEFIKIYLEFFYWEKKESKVPKGEEHLQLVPLEMHAFLWLLARSVEFLLTSANGLNEPLGSKFDAKITIQMILYGEMKSTIRGLSPIKQIFSMWKFRSFLLRNKTLWKNSDNWQKFIKEHFGLFSEDEMELVDNWVEVPFDSDEAVRIYMQMTSDAKVHQQIVYLAIVKLIALSKEIQRVYCNLSSSEGTLGNAKRDLALLVGHELVIKLEEKFPEILEIDSLTLSAKLKLYKMYLEQKTGTEQHIITGTRLALPMLLLFAKCQIKQMPKSVGTDQKALQQSLKEKLKQIRAQIYPKIGQTHHRIWTLCILQQFINFIREIKNEVNKMKEQEIQRWDGGEKCVDVNEQLRAFNEQHLMLIPIHYKNLDVLMKVDLYEFKEFIAEKPGTRTRLKKLIGEKQLRALISVEHGEEIRNKHIFDDASLKANYLIALISTDETDKVVAKLSSFISVLARWVDSELSPANPNKTIGLNQIGKLVWPNAKSEFEDLYDELADDSLEGLAAKSQLVRELAKGVRAFVEAKRHEKNAEKRGRRIGQKVRTNHLLTEYQQMVETARHRATQMALNGEMGEDEGGAEGKAEELEQWLHKAHWDTLLEFLNDDIFRVSINKGKQQLYNHLKYPPIA
ncbi:hypothetical protein niasHT_029999 [Heterodera trifolii]|uniref:Uncharacterized protein n=1 Tax=Heterodera trifolii TaxID=157864 RepID=A0ABD2JJJ4_9BILA